MMRGKNTSNPKTNKTNQTRTPNNNKGQRPAPPHLEVFPLYEGETGEKSWL